ncbi:DUF1648 domain-containing protein [Candidatus Fermentibacteria bacterium]|nr:DUF1648 domain-containing protein [Candidatus Fermentibacteria bacterium]
MRNALILAFVANIILTVASLEILPDRVAIHFGSGGRADGWGSRDFHTLLTLIMHVFFFCVFYYAPRWVTAVPASWVNIPNKRFWLSPAKKEHTKEKLASLMWPFGTAFFLFFLVTGLLTLQANHTDPPRLDERSFLVALALFLVYTAIWVVAWIKEFKVPEGERPPRA